MNVLMVILLSVAWTFFAGSAPPEAESVPPQLDIEHVRNECEASKNGMSCAMLAHSYHQGEDVPQDLKLAREYAELACEYRAPSACTRLAILFLNAGRGGPADLERARGLVLAECDGGDQFSCVVASEYLARGWGGPVDGVRARALAKAGCEYGDPLGCSQLAHLWLRGIGGPQDTARAQAHLTRVCKNGDALSCGMLAWIALGEGRDDEALRVGRGACDMGCKFACHVVGTLLWREDGDTTAAEPLLRAACGEHTAEACASLALLLRERGDRDAAREVMAPRLDDLRYDCEILYALDGEPCALLAEWLAAEGAASAKEIAALRQRAKERLDAWCAKGEKGNCRVRDWLFQKR